MPLRLQLLRKCWSTVDLPILPFLAPRVFQLWSSPRQEHRTLSTTGNAPYPPLTNYDACGSSDLDFRRAGASVSVVTASNAARNGRSRPQKPLRSRSGGHPQPSTCVAPSNSLENITTASSSRGYHSSHYNDGGITPEDEFRRKYMDIWGQEPPNLHDSSPAPRKLQKQAWVAHDRKPSDPTPLRIRRVRAWNQGLAATLSRKRNERALLRRRLRAHDQYEAKRLRIPSASVKFARHVFNKDSRFILTSGSWHRRFAIINLQHQHFMRGRTHSRLFARPRFKVPPDIEQHLMCETTADSLAKAWREMNDIDRHRFWPELMLKTLTYYPDKALDALSAVYIDPHPPSFAIGDCLDYIISHHLRDPKSLLPETAHKVWERIEAIMLQGPKSYIHLSQSSIHLLLSHLDLPQVKQLYVFLNSWDHPLHSDTLIQFASRLAKSGARTDAVQIVKRLAEEGCNFDNRKIESLCTTVLRRRSIATETSVTDSEILGLFLKYGMKPNNITYDVLVSNSLLAHDNNTAWQIHDMVLENGVYMNAHTYSWLLNDAKLRRDVPAIERVIKCVNDAKIRNAHVATDLLHAIFLLHKGRTSTGDPYPQDKIPHRSLFLRMLEVYAEYFHLEPLARLIPNFTEKYSNITIATPTSVPLEELMIPGPPTLVVMLTGYLRALTNAQEPLEFYENFRNHVLAGDPAVAELTRTPHVYNLVLMSFGEFSERLPDCPNVIADMLASAGQETSFPDTEDDGTEDSKEAAKMEANEQPIETTSETNNLSRDQITSETSLGEDDSGNEDLDEVAEMRADERSLEVTSENHNLFDSQTSPGPSLSAPTNTSFTSRVAQDPYTDWRSVNSPSPPAPPPSLTPPQPDVYTWSILLDIFISHRQPLVAEKIITMMAARGILPNQVTWNTLCVGYARLQDPSMTADAIQRMEVAGFVVDDVVLHGVELLKDRKRLVDALMRGRKSASRKKRPMGERIFLGRLVKALDGRGPGMKRVEGDGEGENRDARDSDGAEAAKKSLVERDEAPERGEKAYYVDRVRRIPYW